MVITRSYVLFVSLWDPSKACLLPNVNSLHFDLLFVLCTHIAPRCCKYPEHGTKEVKGAFRNVVETNVFQSLWGTALLLLLLVYYASSPLVRSKNGGQLLEAGTDRRITGIKVPLVLCVMSSSGHKS